MAITLNGTTGITTTGLTADTNTLYVDTTNDRVGVGTTSPNNSKLHVVANSADGAGPLKLEAYNVYNTGFAVNNGATNVGQFGTRAMLIGGSTDEFGVFANGTAQTLMLGTNNTERMRIIGTGQVAVNGTPASGNTFSAFSIGTDNAAKFGNNASTPGVYLAYNGNTWSSYSDARLKNITGTYTNPLSDIAQIEAIKFTWKDDESNAPQVGVTAQSVEKVIPEAIGKDMVNGVEYLSVRYTEIIPLLVASIQEQQAIITDLKARIETLENK